MTPVLGSDELASWLRLAQASHVGCRSAAQLLAQFGSPAAVFAASDAALAPWCTALQLRALRQPVSRELSKLISRTQQWSEQADHHVLTLGCAGYPPALAEIADAPVLLYVKGRLDALAGPALAVVGSRNASSQGRLDAHAFARALSSAGVCVVSGLALGIDTAAHEGALLGVGATVAVLGTGLDHIYPLRNVALAQRIAQAGCLVSECALGTPPLAANFPRRNRIISALAAGVLVVEAAARSGSLITARLAAEQGREVFAVPGSIHSALAKGCHRLIREGAQLVESVDEILLALRASPLLAMALQHGAGAGLPAPTDACEPDSALLEALGYAPLTLDELQARLGLGVGELGVQLLALELSGQIGRLADGRIQRLCRTALA